MANVDYAYPLDSIVNYDGNGVPSFDRAVSSLVLRRLYSYLFTNGVMLATDSTALQVGVSEGMKVSVNAGFTVINGALRLFAEPRTLAIQASENEDRIDTVVARLDLNQSVRNIDLYVLKGTSGSTPVRPELTRNDSVYELGLADLFISAGTTTIPQARITDTRLDTQRCGVVSSISEFDTSAFYDQIQADLAHFKSENEADFSTWSSQQKSAFQTWFDTIKVILDGDVAGHLQNEIDGLSSSKANNTDIANISITGTTNNTGGTILARTLFYLNGSLCKTLVDVADGATFTLNTNYNTTTITDSLSSIPRIIYLGSYVGGFTRENIINMFNSFILNHKAGDVVGLISASFGYLMNGYYTYGSDEYISLILNTYGGDRKQYRIAKEGNNYTVSTLDYSNVNIFQ